ncbi:MAG: GNAT family N-acetyltransferase, partial [Rhodothermales bacterium]
NAFLPPAWSRGNPIDVLGDADENRYARALEIAENDERSDGLLVVLTPQDMTDPTAVAESVARYARSGDRSGKKPLLASWMGGASVAAGESILNQADIPTFAYPDTAARVFNYMWRYSYNLRALYETPSVPDLTDDREAREATSSLIESVRTDGRDLLTEHESKRVLEAYGLPTTTSRLADTADDAAAAADEIGYPVVLKLNSYTITHKSDVGGVRLNLGSADAVRRAFEDMRSGLAEQDLLDGFNGVSVQPMIRRGGYELIVGSSIDPQFGPVLLFGAGGTMVEVFRDRALALPPLTTTLARRMMEQTKIYAALQGVRGRKPVDMDALEKILVRFSQLVVEQPMIKEIDINPLLASEDGILALDARVVLHKAGTELDDLPRTAIRPYPYRYASEWTMSDGTPVNIRPIRPEDEPAVARFHKSLSEESVYLRYANMLKLSQRVAHERLSHLCFIDYDREMALVAERIGEDGEPSPEIIGIGRLTRIGGTNESEFALLIGDSWQGRGLGTEMLKRLVEIGRDEGHDRIKADVLRENIGMKRVCEHVGFHPELDGEPADPTMKFVHDL